MASEVKRGRIRIEAIPVKDSEKKKDNTDDYEGDDNGVSKDEDLFGEKFEIPAFLRKIH